MASEAITRNDLKAILEEVLPSTPIITTKKVTASVSLPADTIYTETFTVNDSKYNIIKGFAITTHANCAVMQCYFSASNIITMRVRSFASNASPAGLEVYYA